MDLYSTNILSLPVKLYLVSKHSIHCYRPLAYHVITFAGLNKWEFKTFCLETREAAYASSSGFILISDTGLVHFLECEAVNSFSVVIIATLTI